MASSLTGAIVGTFKVGMGVTVGPPTFKPDKPKITLKGKVFATTVISGDVDQVQPPKCRMTLAAKTFGLIVSSTPQFGAAIGSPRTQLILRGKVIRLVTPTKSIHVKAKLILEGRHYDRVTSFTMQPGKAKLILRGGDLGKVGTAGMVPTVPVTGLLTPIPADVDEVLVPSAPYTGLLVPTVEEFV